MISKRDFSSCRIVVCRHHHVQASFRWFISPIHVYIFTSADCSRGEIAACIGQSFDIDNDARTTKIDRNTKS